jgi:hypothetical protein
LDTGLNEKDFRREKLMNKTRYLIIVGIVVAAVALAILFYTILGNHRPVITSLVAEPAKILPRQSCQIVCNATDPDGDELSYGWSASGGTISGITIAGEEATVTWTAPGSAGFYDVTVIVMDSCGSAVTDSVTITVRTNTSPAINNLTADADWTLPLGSLNVTCDASDPDGDELSYEWSTDGGDISGTGAVVNWIAPQGVGIYNVTVVVNDGYGGSATTTLPITVAPEQPPIIQELRITNDRDGGCYLKKDSGGYKVGQGKVYDIECIVADTSMELSYEWSCTGGELSGEGSLATWTAPNTTTKVTITVIVSDIARNMASKNLVLSVVGCSPCTFGSCVK